MKLYDIVILAGFALIIIGIATFSWRAAIIVAGLLLLGLGVKLMPRLG